ncbi:MAG: polysaccharide deacetylase [Clostridia bacterium]|nr:polysaccharide deacetylase [Clostridia bacterium]
MKLLIINKKTIKNFSYLFLIILFFSLIIYIYLDNNNSNANKSENHLSAKIRNNIQNIYENNEKTAYLTFDDGPSKTVTPKILDILKQNNTLANFFVVGKHVEKYPELVKRAYEDGHFIANHSYSHNNSKLYKSKQDFINEILETDKEIAKAIGKDMYCSHIFRFPNGSMSKIHYSDKKKAIKYLEEIDYTYIDWNALNNDSMKKYSNSELISNLKNSIKNKGTIVILMHDTGDVNKTYDILEESINIIKSEGYEFKTFYELLK